MEIKIVDYGSELYNESVRLREKILRLPLGMKFTPQALEQDKHCIHIIAVDNGRVVGTTLLKPIDNHTVKIRQVAVDYDYRQKGIGKRLMQFAEDYARHNGFKTALLHARYYVLDFYKKLDYSPIGDSFTEVGIKHYLMTKKL